MYICTLFCHIWFFSLLYIASVNRKREISKYLRFTTRWMIFPSHFHQYQYYIISHIIPALSMKIIILNVNTANFIPLLLLRIVEESISFRCISRLTCCFTREQIKENRFVKIWQIGSRMVFYMLSIFTFTCTCLVIIITLRIFLPQFKWIIISKNFGSIELYEFDMHNENENQTKKAK